MKIKLHSTVIITDNFEVMKTFYLELLKQQIEFDFGNCIGFKGGLSLWELRPEYPIAQHLGRTYSKLGNKNLEICFESDEFADVVTELNKQEIKYLHQVAEETWGQMTVRFFDPENNLIEIGETIPCFVKRFHKQGMTEEEVSKRTSVPLELVKKYINESEQV